MNNNTPFELSATVESILRKKKSTRDNDDLLYVEVCKKLNPNITEANFIDVMGHRVKYGIPVYESVRRARAKIQASNEELRGKTYSKPMRSKMVNEYLKYSTVTTKK